MADSRRKGSAGERDFARAVRDVLGVTLVRRLDQARSGGHDLAPDPGDGSPAARALARYAIECKRHRDAPPGSVALWWAQTRRQAGAAGLLPLLAYRPDRRPWSVVVDLAALVPDAPPGEHTATLTVEGFAATLQRSTETPTP